MSASLNFSEMLLSRLPIGFIMVNHLGEAVVSEYLTRRHSTMRLPPEAWEMAEVDAWIRQGVFPATPVFVLDDEHYQLEDYVFEKGRALVFWPLAAAARFSPQIRQIEQLYLDFREIYRNSFDGIFIADGSGKTLMVNEGCERNYGMPASAFVGKHVTEFEKSGMIRPVIATRVIETRERVTAIQETRIGKTIMVTGIPLLDAQGNVRKVVINSRDATEFIALQEDLARAQEKLHRYELEVSELRRSTTLIPGISLRSPSMQEIGTIALKIAKVNTTVLITGESGVGKDVLARYIHAESARSDGPLVKLNCGAIPRDLLESELFGYEPGAFTGAQRQGKIGIVEAANKGTLFLDEIGELSLDLQVKLLQVLQDKTVTRLGSTRPISVDVRVIAATNRDLQEMVDARTFRSDLYYRLNVVPLHVPPLRERREDILPLVQNFLDELNEQYGSEKRISEQALAALLDYEWPGNVRELHNIIERLVVTTPDSLIRSDFLPTNIFRPQTDEHADEMDLKSQVERFEHRLVTDAVERYGSTRAAADHLKISQSTVVRRLASSKNAVSGK